MKLSKGFWIAVAVSAAIAVLVYWLGGVSEQAQYKEAAWVHLQVLARMAENWKAKHGTYPDPLPSPPDPWGNPYRLQPGGDHLHVCSNGPDGKADTRDDLCGP